MKPALRRLAPWPALLLLLLWPVLAWAQVQVPPLDGPVVDPAGALRPATRAALEQQARALQARKGGAQLQVLLVGSTGQESIEAYAQRVFDQWQLGRKGVDDGVLLLVAVQDRHVRIQPGYGLEGAIPDAYAKRIIEEAILPRFREGDLDQGVLDGSALLAGLVDGEPLPPPRSNHLLDLAWQGMDTILLLALVAGFALGRWHGRAAAVPVPRWSNRPLHWLALIALAGLATAVWVPRQIVPMLFLLAMAVPLAWVCGHRWRRSPSLRRTLWGLLVASIAISVAVLATRGVFPGLFVHVALYFLAGIAAVVLWFPLTLARDRWQESRRGFALRVLLLGTVMGAGLVWTLLQPDRLDTEALLLVFGAVGYMGWAVAMLVGTGTRSDDDDDDRRGGWGSSSSSSSSSSDWSGGGGRSGGGGASGSW